MKQSMTVAAWLDSYDNPMNAVVRRVRDIILHADPRIEEGIDGNAPTFSYRGTFMSVFPESKKHASLMFERGAEIPGHHPRLEGTGETRRVMKIGDMSEANAATYDLQHLVRSWCDWRDAETAASGEPEGEAGSKSAAKKKAAPRKKAEQPAAKKKAAARKKAASPAAKKTAAKKSAGKKSAGKKAAAKKPAGKKAGAKKIAPKKTGTGKGAARPKSARSAHRSRGR